MGVKKINEIDGFISELMRMTGHPGTIEDVKGHKHTKWLRRRLRALVRKAYKFGYVHREQENTVVNLTDEELELRQVGEIKNLFGFKP